jgi:hypothetical protein
MLLYVIGLLKKHLRAITSYNGHDFCFHFFMLGPGAAVQTIHESPCFQNFACNEKHREKTETKILTKYERQKNWPSKRKF